MTTLEKAARAPSEEALAALIKPLWLAAKPGQTAQRIRSELSVAFDDPQFSQWAADYIPEYVWDLLDIAAQRGIDSLSSALLDPSDEVVHAMLQFWHARVSSHIQAQDVRDSLRAAGVKITETQ